MSIARMYPTARGRLMHFENITCLKKILVSMKKSTWHYWLAWISAHMPIQYWLAYFKMNNSVRTEV